MQVVEKSRQMQVSRHEYEGTHNKDIGAKWRWTFAGVGALNADIYGHKYIRKKPLLARKH